MMFLFQSEIIAESVVWAQKVGFALWVLFLALNSYWAIKELRQIRRCRNVSSLTDFLLQNYSESNTGEDQLPRLISDDEAEEYFNDFAKNHKLPKKSPIYTHLKTIFLVGLKENQLDVEALIKNTSNRLITNNVPLRSALTLFIIVGLFGTLFGLSDSLAQLSTIAPGTTQLNNVMLSDALKILLGKLGGAFAPSIWGVLFTIAGIVLFAFYLRAFSQHVCEVLERQTVSNWVPNLIMNSSRRMLEKLRLGRQQMEKNFEAAEKVANFAEEIKSKTGDLAEGIENASASLSKLEEAVGSVTGASNDLIKFSNEFMGNLNQFADRFETSINTLSPFGEKLSNLYQQITRDSAEFRQEINKSIEESKNFRELTLKDSTLLRNQVKEEFDRQNAQAHKVLEALEIHNERYLEKSAAIETKLDETLSSAKNALDNLRIEHGVLINGLVKEFGDPIRKDLQSELTKLTGALGAITPEIGKKLNEVSEASGRKLDNVTDNINIKLQEVSQSIDSNLTNISQKIHTNFKDVSQTFDKNFREVSKDINSNLKEVSKNIDTNLKDVANHIGRVEHDLRGLEVPVNNSAKAIDATAKSFYGQTEKFFEKIQREFQTQNQQNGNQNTNLEDLNEGIQNLIRGLDSLGKELKTYNQQKPFVQQRSYISDEKPEAAGGRKNIVTRIETPQTKRVFDEPQKKGGGVYNPAPPGPQPEKENIARRIANWWQGKK